MNMTAYISKVVSEFYTFYTLLLNLVSWEFVRKGKKFLSGTHQLDIQCIEASSSSADEWIENFPSGGGGKLALSGAQID
jgi:hypothetical protein